MNQAAHKISKIFDEPEGVSENAENEFEGQLAIDVYETEDAVVIKAPIAGVRPEDLDISITGDLLKIKGERKEEVETKKENYLYQECYWGTFSRAFTLPKGLDSEGAKANLKNGVLQILIPKEAKSKTKVLKIETD